MPRALQHSARKPVSDLLRGFRAIPIASLRLDTVTDFDIYIVTREGTAPVLFRARNLKFDAAAFDALQSHRHEEIYISTAQNAEYRAYIEENLPSLLKDPAIPVDAKCEVVYDSAQGLVSDVMKDPRSGELMQRSRDMVATTSEFMRTEAAAFERLLPLASYDYYTYTHSVNVFVFSFALAQRAGFNDPEILRQFGEGTLLHDIGKSMIDPDIINCRGKLSDDQWKQMRMHPAYGYDILKEHGGFSDLTLTVVRHHHEKLRGGGYPDGLRGSQIQPLVRISTIADIFDALTTKRSYKGALDSFPALRIMKDEILPDLDPDYFRLFVEMMGRPTAH